MVDNLHWNCVLTSKLVTLEEQRSNDSKTHNKIEIKVKEEDIDLKWFGLIQTKSIVVVKLIIS